MAAADPALDALFLPLAEGHVAWPADGALFLRAREGAALHAAPRPGLACVQPFRPQADALARAGFAVAPDAAADDGRRWPLVLLLPPRQREEARAWFARALARVAPGGVLLASQHNDEGGRSGQADLARLAGPLQALSKHHCRVYWTQAGTGGVDAGLAAEWRALDAPRPLADARLAEAGLAGRWLSRPGVFAWDRVDAGSALLARHLPADLAGDAADLGAGWGFLAGVLLARCPRLRAMDLYEADARALELARANLAANAPGATPGFHWHDVAAGLPRRYDVIVSNPPFHAQDRIDRPELGQRFIAAAAQALAPRGRLWLVANRHLPYEAALGAHFAQVRTVAQEGGFKVVEAVRGAA
ncbi:MAG TPA: class I SAM-dependent methyltransferase [Xanthomonadaceae bacterium]|nr:class I SAM-dependent methyltransferase [Xanthomonadaceae bacterium]